MDGALAITTRGLTKRFGDVTAVAGLDLDVPRGEVFGFLGPNGAGKTTTIRILLDAIRATSGTATVLGGEPSDPEVRRRIGYLPSQLRIDPRYTADDVVAFFARLRGGVDMAIVDALCERFELDRTRPFGELSSGNQRKVGIVQAFMHEPDLVVLDEPTSGLDPLLQREFLRLVREVGRRGTTVFMSSHVLLEVERAARRVAIIRAGRLVRVTSIARLRATARHRMEIRSPQASELADALAGTEGVRSVRRRGSVVHVVVQGSVDAVVKTAARFAVDRLRTPDTELEETFLGLYRRVPERPGHREGAH